MKTIVTTVFICALFGLKLTFADSLVVPSVYVPSNRIILVTEAIKAHIDPQELLAIAMCESTMNPKATNGISFGILQFIPSTWQRYTSLLKIANPDIWNVQQQAQVASYLFSIGQEKQWSCFHIIHRL